VTELQRTLSKLARGLEYPPTPAVAAAVEHRLRAERPARPIRKRRVAIALVVALVLPTAPVAAVPSIRHAFLELLGIRDVQIVRTSSLPPLPSAGKLELGQPSTLERAARLASFKLLVPHIAELGTPDELYYRRSPVGGELSFVYRARAGIPRSSFTHRGLVLSEFLGTDAPVFARKFAGPGTSVESVTVAGQAGVWLAGAPHEFGYIDAHGQTQVESLRLAGNTLLWPRGRVTLRLEGAISKRAALRIASSVR
jgi:hypothetical protein